MDLNTCRQAGMGIGSIPWTAMREWEKAHCLDEDEIELLEHCIRHMDGVFLKHHKEESERKQKQARGNQPGRRGRR